MTDKIEKLGQAAAEVDDLSIGLADALADMRGFRAVLKDENAPAAVVRQWDRWEAETQAQIARNEATVQLYAREIEKLQRRAACTADVAWPDHRYCNRCNG